MNDIIALLITVAGIAIVIWFLNWDSKRSARLKKEKAEREQAEAERKQREHDELVEKARRLRALTEVMKQAKMMGDTDTYYSAMHMTYDGNLPEIREDGAWTSIYDDLRILKIAGMNYRGNLSAYVGNFKGMLVPELKNEYDPFAIMVKVDDGKHVGYIKEDQTGMVRWLVGAEQPLGENEPTIFKPYRVEGFIDEREDEDGRKYYEGCVYVRKKKEE
ncbi:MAG: HIRAN domain-containing protein [Prevotella sp.]